MTSVFRGSDNFDTAGGNAVKAWVNFNGTGTVAIRASYNVSSITDNGVGDYTVNFATALVDANYAVVGGLKVSNDAVLAGNPATFNPFNLAVGSFRFVANDSGVARDPANCSAAVLR